MYYRCIKKIKGFIFAKYLVGQAISSAEYNDLAQPEKECFVEDNSDDNSDETIADQFEENQEADDKAEKN